MNLSSSSHFSCSCINCRQLPYCITHDLQTLANSQKYENQSNCPLIDYVPALDVKEPKANFFLNADLMASMWSCILAISTPGSTLLPLFYISRLKPSIKRLLWFLLTGKFPLFLSGWGPKIVGCTSIASLTLWLVSPPVAAYKQGSIHYLLFH